MSSPSDPMPLDGMPLKTEELVALRGLLRDEDRAKWARRQLRVVGPLLVAVVVGVYQFVDWAWRHLKFQL